MRFVILALSLTLGSPVTADETPDPMSLGQHYTEAFFADDLADMWTAMNSEMHAAIGSLQQLQRFRDHTVASLGRETELLSEETSERGGYDVYVRVARFELSPTPIVFTLSFDVNTEIGGLFVQPQTEPADSP